MRDLKKSSHAAHWIKKQLVSSLYENCSVVYMLKPLTFIVFVMYYEYECCTALDNFSKTIVAFWSDSSLFGIKCHHWNLHLKVPYSLKLYNFIHKNKYANFKCGACLRPYMLSQLVYAHTEMSWTLWRVKSRLFNKDTEMITSKEKRKKTTLFWQQKQIMENSLFLISLSVSLSRAHNTPRRARAERHFFKSHALSFLLSFTFSFHMFGSKYKRWEECYRKK